jgi:hypothetical protein
MHDRAVRTVAPPDRHLQRVDDELGAEMISDRVADHPSRPYVEHDRAIHLATVGRMLGDVGDPELVRSIDGKGTIDEIIVRLGLWITSRTASRSTPIHARDTGEAHQPCDALAADADAGTEAELGMHAWGAVGAARLAVDLDDRLGQVAVFACSRGIDAATSRPRQQETSPNPNTDPRSATGEAVRATRRPLRRDRRTVPPGANPARHHGAGKRA